MSGKHNWVGLVLLAALLAVLSAPIYLFWPWR